jgi:maleylacetate reductase
LITPFVYESAPVRVLFGAGTVQQLRAEVARLGVSRALVLSTPEQAALGRQCVEWLGELAAGLFAEAAMHTPVEVTERALAMVASRRADALVSIGGGSTTGLGKAIAVRTDLPQVVLPTTYAGSEMTSILGETENGLKTTRRDPRIRPEVVLYDVDLTLSLPRSLSVTSGLNAIAHAVEALYAVDANPITSLMAEEGVAALVRALPEINTNTTDTAARWDALYGAWLCGICLDGTSMALHHKLCHTLGGSFGLPHAETHSVILPHAVAYNAAAATQAMGRLGRALGATGDPATALYQLARRLHAPLSLRELGLDEADIGRAAGLAAAKPYPNPRMIERAGIEALLRRAWAGEAPKP